MPFAFPLYSTQHCLPNIYIARRLIRFSSEDIGIADPHALVQANAAYTACTYIGLPECDLALAQAVVYLARAPKSNDLYTAFAKVSAVKMNIISYAGSVHMRVHVYIGT
jgi:putative ATPase